MNKLNLLIEIDVRKNLYVRIWYKNNYLITIFVVSDVDIKQLKNTVNANILGIPFPFVGVDGEDACKYISKSNGTKAGCDLKSGEEYTYSNKIEVLKIYPKVKIFPIYLNIRTFFASFYSLRAKP